MTDLQNQIQTKLNCERRPNCVSSVADRKSQFLKPISIHSTMDKAKFVLLDMIQKNPQALLIEAKENYVHATFKSKLFGFIDDVEFIFNDCDKKIHFRSKSQLGYYDFGVNRKRMIAIKRHLEGLI